MKKEYLLTAEEVLKAEEKAFETAVWADRKIHTLYDNRQYEKKNAQMGA